MATQKRTTKLLTGSASQADTQDADTQALLTEADMQALLLTEADMQRLVLTEADMQAFTSATAESKHKTDCLSLKNKLTKNHRRLAATDRPYPFAQSLSPKQGIGPDDHWRDACQHYRAIATLHKT